ncbi:hypothetical protein [Halobacterium sp. CBA1126]|uniref:hypothetical protein n=1 Tax=Halobacterium sp. CBA1126 TaxID=2668074 RepID=UPI0012F7231F|nr:hypothetical protein [Halobacterium sp. CBA1126]MUV59770.1 hypothetical protein [Halobacterium sp. CBA1126]
MSLLHEQYEHDGSLVVFTCTECGYTSLSIGTLHAHIETHWSILGWLKFHTVGFVLPSSIDRWMEYTAVRRVDETSEVPVEEVMQ